ncbi:hypothetical protein SAMN04488102_1089 [Alkalibacterium subtropicum]|uniref:Uncharacterized protein n=1 Tax=Alkalibacterium subtropicum TaxID=753702 RepID=A0A1I1JHH2_9LACT|nr:hypothetical protein SAMN04488102_1089 [Alkalibacterium subtropicum]
MCSIERPYLEAMNREWTEWILNILKRELTMFEKRGERREFYKET